MTNSRMMDFAVETRKNGGSAAKTDLLTSRISQRRSLTSEADGIQKPHRQSFCRSLRRDFHSKSFILSSLIYGCLTAIFWCRLCTQSAYVQPYPDIASFAGSSEPSVVIQADAQGQQPLSYPVSPSRLRYRLGGAGGGRGGASRGRVPAGPCDDVYIYIPIAFVVMLYMVYLVECWHCHTRLDLKYKMDVPAVYELMTSMRRAPPVVWWKAVSYHYVRRARHVTRYRNGEAYTAAEGYYERVNSHTSASSLDYSLMGSRDMSKRLVGLEHYPATKIVFSKSFSFANDDAEKEFVERRATFFRSAESQDDYAEFREGLYLMNINFREQVIAVSSTGHYPWYLSRVTFWLAAICLLSWPLRVLIGYCTATVHYRVHKVFGCNYTPSAEDDGVNNDRVSCASDDREFSSRTTSETGSSCSQDLEKSILIRCKDSMVVPSYSEVMRLNDRGQHHWEGGISSVPRRTGLSSCPRSSLTSPGLSSETTAEGRGAQRTRPRATEMKSMNSIALSNSIVLTQQRSPSTSGNAEPSAADSVGDVADSIRLLDRSSEDVNHRKCTMSRSIFQNLNIFRLLPTLSGSFITKLRSARKGQTVLLPVKIVTNGDSCGQDTQLKQVCENNSITSPELRTVDPTPSNRTSCSKVKSRPIPKRGAYSYANYDVISDSVSSSSSSLCSQQDIVPGVTLPSEEMFSRSSMMCSSRYENSANLVLLTSSEDASPPPSYESALNMKVVPTVVLPRAKQSPAIQLRSFSMNAVGNKDSDKHSSKLCTLNQTSNSDNDDGNKYILHSETELTVVKTDESQVNSEMLSTDAVASGEQNDAEQNQNIEIIVTSL